MKLAHLLVLGSVFLLPMGAHAQWQWLDKNNKKVFSDQGPPPDIPEKNILRRPGSQQRPATPASPVQGAEPDASAPEQAAAAPAAAGGAKPSGVDKELEEKTRKTEEAEKAKKAAEDKKIAQAKADNCKRARESKSTFESGVRIVRQNAQGEREFLDDKQRADEQRRLQSIIEADCK